MQRPWDSERLFDLSHFAHKGLFAGGAPAWQALGRLKDYCRAVAGNAASYSIPAGAWIVNPEAVFIGEGTIIEPGAYIAGPCIIGRRCAIRHGAYIRGYVVTGDDCVIGHTTEIKNSIMLNGAKAAHFAYVGDSILGNDVNLGAGAKCANLKLRRSTITLRYEGETIDTGREKLGALLGDGVQIGCNAVTNPGTVVGRGALWYPCVNRGGVIAAGSVVR